MAKYGGLSGVSTASIDLYDEAKTAKAWTSYTPWKKVSFIPTADCTIKVNDQDDVIPVTADLGWSDDGTQITKFVVVENSIPYILSYRY